MPMELSGEEIKYLDNVLERHMTSLIREINHTDSFEYKRDLRAEADFLNTLKKKFEKGIPVQRAS